MIDAQCGFGSASSRDYLFMPNLLNPSGMFASSVCVSGCPDASDDTMFASVSVSLRYTSESCKLVCITAN